MKKILSLLRVMLRTFDFNMSFVSSKKKARGKKSRGWIVLVILLGVSILPMAIGAGVLLSKLFDALSLMNMQQLIVSAITSAAAMVIFVFGIANIIAVFYYANDVERYLSLPVKPTEILVAKFLTTVIYEYFICVLLALPVYILYGVKSGADAVFYIYALIITLLLPIVPIALASVPAMLLMRFTRIFRNRDAVNIVFFILILAFIMYVQFGFTGIAMKLEGGEAELVKSFIDRMGKLSSMSEGMFVGTGFASQALANYDQAQGVINILMYLITTAAAFIVFLLLGQLVYFKGVLGLSASAASGPRTTLTQLGRLFKERTTTVSYMLKDFRVMLRSPIFFLNNIFMIFFLPLFLLLMFYLPGIMQADAEGQAIMNALNNLKFDMLKPVSSMVFIIALAGGLLMGGMNSITSSALSREGSNFNVMKFIPVSYKTQVMAKVWLGYLCGLASSLLTLVIITIMLKVPLVFAVLMFLPMAVGAFIPNIMGILPELYWPKLHWDHEQKAVKQNLNVLVEILGGMGLMGLAIYGGTVLMNIGVLPVAMLFITIGAAVLVNIILYAIVRRTINKRMPYIYV